MRVLHLTDDLNFMGGIQIYLLQLLESSNRRGIKTRIYSAAQNTKSFTDYLDRWMSPKHLLNVRRILREFEPDLVHVHGVSLALSPLPLLAPKWINIPVLMTIHDFNYLCPRKWMIYSDGKSCRYSFGMRCLVSDCHSNKNGRKYIPYHAIRWLKIGLHRTLLRRTVDHFVCPSRKLYLETRKKWKVRKLSYLANFVIQDSVMTPVKSNRNLLFVGRLSKEKGMECLLKAIARVTERVPEVRLTVVGDGPEKNKLQALSEELRINDSVNFTGEVEHQKLNEYYRDSAICILPSLWMENCPISGIEALAHGRALIGSEIGGIPDLVKKGKNGFLFPPNEYKQLAHYLLELLGKPDLVEEFSRNSRCLFEEYFTESIHMERLIQIYSKTVQSKVSK